MSFLYPAGPWPATATPGTPAALRPDDALAQPGGRHVAAARADDTGQRWTLKRNCSLPPRRLLAVFLALGLLPLAIGMAFWLAGAPGVLPFAGIELLGLAAALLIYAHHAADHEDLRLAHGELCVEHRCGSRTEGARFRVESLRVAIAPGRAGLVELTGQGQRMLIGRYLRPEWRSALALELRRSLHDEAARQRHEESKPER